MQTFEKLAHAPMPFTSGGQTITDRLNAAKHSLAGSQLGKTICKATTEELMAPKKKHLDYLLHCTNEPNVSIPSMANLLIERTQNPNWVVVYKALITIHNLMCYGNERFSQYLASCNTTFNLTNFVDKNNLTNGAIAAGYDMSSHVRRYGKYISEKIHTYRLCAFDFCKVKRGRDDGLLRTLHTDKLLKTMPILQSQIDALLEFQVNSSELNNGVINCSFILLFRDLIRMFACYNDGVINLLEKYFDMNKKQCREALDLYKSFLSRLDKVSAFLGTAESVGIDRGEVPDLTRAPASLLEALESHLYHLEGGRGPPPTSSAQQMVSQQISTVYQEQLYQQSYNLDEAAKQRYLEEEKERLRQYEEERRRQLQQQGGPTSSGAALPPGNPFGAPSTPHHAQLHNAADLLFFDTPPKGPNAAGQQQQIDSSNPFAMVAEINNRAQQTPAQYHFNMPPTANPFAGSGPIAPPTFTPHPPMAPPVSNPFAPVPLHQPYTGAHAALPAQYPHGSAPPYWPPQTGISAPMSVASAGGLGGIYTQTPFSGSDGSYSAPSTLRQHMEAPQRPSQPPVFNPQWPPTPHSAAGNSAPENSSAAAQTQPYNQQQVSSQNQWTPTHNQPGQGSNPFGAPAYPLLSGGNPF